MEYETHLIVLAGGKGERAWPLSTTDTPKQFSLKTDHRSLFQECLIRNQFSFDRYWILTLEKYFFTVIDQLSELTIQKTGCFLEPVGRGTLPVLILTLLNLPQEDLFFLTPSDLKIEESQKYFQFIERMKGEVKQKKLILAGKKPTYPETGFGYILANKEGKVSQFIEKPDLDLAKELLEKEDIFWNCGMVMSEVGFFLNQVQCFLPELYLMCHLLNQLQKKEQWNVSFIRFPMEAYLNLPHHSIDRAILEKIEGAFVKEALFDWIDLGSFKAIQSHYGMQEKLSLVNSRDVFVEGNTKEVIVQNLSHVAFIEDKERIYLLKL